MGQNSVRRIQNHKHQPVNAYAYVAHGDPASGTLGVRRIRVVGPVAGSEKAGATKLKKLETTWLPMEVDENDMEQLRRDGLVPQSHLGDVLLLSFPSMSLDKEMRFRLNRALVGDSKGWAATGLGARLCEDSIETLACAPEPLTWTQHTWPRQQGVRVEDWGYSLSCLSFID